MAKQTINVGTSANSGGGDPLRNALIKVNENFDEVYTKLAALEDGNVITDVVGSVFSDDSTLLVDGVNSSINLNGTVKGNVVPDVDETYDLGSSTKKFRDLYLSGTTIYLGDTPLSIDNGTLLIDGVAVSGTGGTGDFQGSVFADDSTLLVDGVNASIPYSVLSGAPTIPADISDLTDTTNLLFDGNYGSLSNTPAIPTLTSQLTNDSGFITSADIAGGTLTIDVNNTGDLQGSVFADDSTLLVDGVNGVLRANINTPTDFIVTVDSGDSSPQIWQFNTGGVLTFPNGQQVDAEDANELLIGSPNSGLILNSQTRSSRLVAKKTFDREFNDSVDHTFSATVGPPHLITVTFGTDTGLYLLALLERLEIKLSNGSTDFRYDYSNIRMVINPYAEAIPANISMVSQTSGTTWEITIDQDPAAVVGNVTDIQILYDYNNTVGLDVGEDMFGIATDNDDIDIRSGRDIDLIAADDITFRAGSTFDLTLLRNDDQDTDSGIEIITESSTLTNIWKFQFDGLLQVPGNIAGTDGIVITPENGETYAYLNLPSDANSADNGVAIGNDNGKIELRTTDQGTAITYVWKFDNDGTLTFPDSTVQTTAWTGTADVARNIESENDVSIRVNLTDSTTRIWRFGEDGDLAFPDGTTQSTAFTGTGNLSISGTMIEFAAGATEELITVSPDGFSSAAVLQLPRNTYANVYDTILTNSSGNVKITSGDGGNTYDWRFGADGSLTVPGDIRSNGNINIDINLSDSTLRRWQFGEDGNLEAPGIVSASNFRMSGGEIALGTQAGETNQGSSAVAIGRFSGVTNQGNGSVAVGYSAGSNDQGSGSVAVGYGAGVTSQSAGSIALGYTAGATNQGGSAVAIGFSAGSNNQSATAVAVGFAAGADGQGTSAVAIGNYAGTTNQPANSIIINAGATALEGSAAGFYVNPIRNVDGGAFLNYNATTKEIGVSNDLKSDQQISITVAGEDSTEKTWYFGNDGELVLPEGGDIVDSTGTSVLGGSGGGSALEEPFESKTSATGVIEHDATTNRLFYHTSISANFTANFTNLGLAANEATSISLVLVQGATARMCNAVQIGGAAQTITWQGSASAPSGNANRTDVVTFSILCTATDTYTVLGMLTSFGG